MISMLKMAYGFNGNDTSLANPMSVGGLPSAWTKVARAVGIPNNRKSAQSTPSVILDKVNVKWLLACLRTIAFNELELEITPLHVLRHLQDKISAAPVAMVPPPLFSSVYISMALIDQKRAVVLEAGRALLSWIPSHPRGGGSVDMTVFEMGVVVDVAAGAAGAPAAAASAAAVADHHNSNRNSGSALTDSSVASFLDGKHTIQTIQRYFQQHGFGHARHITSTQTTTSWRYVAASSRPRIVLFHYKAGTKPTDSKGGAKRPRNVDVAAAAAAAVAAAIVAAAGLAYCEHVVFM